MNLLLEGASWFFLVAGAIFCVIGGIGLLRLPDFYSRTHGASITDTAGAGFILLGLILQGIVQTDVSVLVSAKLVLILLFLLITSPTAGHALTKAAFARGIRADVNDDEEGDDVSN